MHLLIVAFLTVLTSGCGVFTDGNNSGSSSLVDIFWPEADQEGDGDSWVSDMDPGEDGIGGSDVAESRFFLDFGGATVTASDSFIVERAPVTTAVIEPFASTDLGSALSGESVEDLKTSIAEKVRGLLDEVNLEILTEEPTDGKPFNRALVGGENFTGQENVLGVAKYDRGDPDKREILFIFSRELANSTDFSALDTVSVVIAHEIGHSVGAQHIENSLATMNPIVSSSADEIDITAPVFGSSSETENTKDVLTMNLGSSSITSSQSELPVISTIGMESQGDFGLLTVFDLENFRANSGLNLSDYTYTWSFDGKTATGGSVTIFFDGPAGSTFEVGLVVSNSSGQSATYNFLVNKA